MIVIKKDLCARFGAARNQGSRPTCLAFAASDAHAAMRDPWEPLSCEYVFFHAQQRDNRPPTVGAKLMTVLDVLRHHGQPVETGWPYLMKFPTSGVWQPPSGLSPLFRRNSRTTATIIDDIIAELDNDSPVLVLTKLSNSFDMVGADGIVDPASGEQPDHARGHAVVAVGHGNVNGQRAVLIRNSWGPKWGANGYGWLTEKFLLPRLYAIAVLMEDLSVSASSAAA